MLELLLLILNFQLILKLIQTVFTPWGGVTRFLGSLKISLCEERRLKDTQNLKCEDRRLQKLLIVPSFED